MDKNKPEKNKRQDHLSEAVLLSYIEGDLKDNDLQAAQAHLNTCSDCLGLVAAVHREALVLSDDAEIGKIVQSVELNVEGQLQRLIDKGMIEPDNGRSAQTQDPTFFLLFLTRLRAISKHARFYYTTVGSLAVAALLIFFIGIPQYMVWQSDGLVEEGALLLTENFALNDRTTPRPAGGFSYNPFFGPKRGGDENSDKTIQALSKFQEAIALNKNNAKAHQYAGLYFLAIETNLDSANHYYQLALENSPANASILNGLGALAWHDSKYDEALDYFRKALKIDPEQLEAHYNIALLYQARGDLQNAKTAWEKYRQLDPNSEWADYAAAQLRNLNNNSF